VTARCCHGHIPGPSAAAHVTGSADGLTDLAGTRGLHRNWRAMLRHGLEAGEMDAAEEAAIEARMRTGRPLGNEAFVEAMELATGRALKPQKRGPKGKSLV